jgi:serine/threonine-protein kinase
VFTDRTGAEYIAVPAGNGVAAFRIGRTEVTNAQYAQCVAAGACTVPEGILKTDCNYSNAAYANDPVVCVTRAQAREYAAWAGGRLPTEAQWTRACQGDDGRTYPWGEAAPDERLANFYYEGRQDVDTTAVGSYPAGASPYGALDMAGNVYEYVEVDDDGHYIVRGGAFSSDADYVVCGARNESDYVFVNYIVGFRVVSPGP